MKRVLVTGAAGYLGTVFLEELCGRHSDLVVAVDVRPTPHDRRQACVEYIELDVRSERLETVMRSYRIDTVVHLATIVTPGPGMTEDVQYSVDVLGTQNVLKACLEAGVRRIIVSSSGAAYGYHPDNPGLIGEDAPLRGNDEFAYSRHKRLVEEMLGRFREGHPELEQTVFRLGTIIGPNTRNQITALFERPFLLVLKGSATPWTFAWDRDVARCLVQAVYSRKTGVFNMTGDGALGLRELARVLGKPCLELPPWLLKAVLTVLHPLRLTPYGPEQVDFLRYRPVLDNTRLKKDFGYVPERSSLQAFKTYCGQAEPNCAS